MLGGGGVNHATMKPLVDTEWEHLSRCLMCGEEKTGSIIHSSPLVSELNVGLQITSDVYNDTDVPLG